MFSKKNKKKKNGKYGVGRGRDRRFFILLGSGNIGYMCIVIVKYIEVYREDVPLRTYAEVYPLWIEMKRGFLYT